MGRIGVIAVVLTLVALAAARFVDAIRDDRASPAVLFAVLLVGAIP